MDRMDGLIRKNLEYWVGLSWVISHVPIEHHPTIRYMVCNGYYKVMSNIPKMGHLPTPVYWHPTFELTQSPKVMSFLTMISAVWCSLRWQCLGTPRLIAIHWGLGRDLPQHPSLKTSMVHVTDTQNLSALFQLGPCHKNLWRKKNPGWSKVALGVLSKMCCVNISKQTWQLKPRACRSRSCGGVSRGVILEDNMPPGKVAQPSYSPFFARKLHLCKERVRSVVTKSVNKLVKQIQQRGFLNSSKFSLPFRVITQCHRSSWEILELNGGFPLGNRI